MKFDKNSLNVGDIVTLFNGKQIAVTKLEWLPSNVVYVYSGNNHLLGIYSPASGDCLSRASSDGYDIVAIGDVDKIFVNALRSRKRAVDLINERFDHLDDEDLAPVEVRNDFDKIANDFCEFVKMTRDKIDEFAYTAFTMKIPSPLSSCDIKSNDKSPANPDNIDVTVEEGKYRFRYVDGKLEAYRYGERWSDFENKHGSSYALMMIIEELHKARIALENTKK